MDIIWGEGGKQEIVRGEDWGEVQLWIMIMKSNFSGKKKVGLFTSVLTNEGKTVEHPDGYSQGRRGF